MWADDPIYERLDKIPEICIEMSTNLYRIMYILDRIDPNVQGISQNFLHIYGANVDNIIDNSVHICLYP